MSIWGGEGSQGGSYVMANFCTSTLETGTSPPPNISVDTWPHKTTSHKTLCCTYSRVRHGVERVENRLTKTLGDVWLLNACWDVTDDWHSIRESQWNLLKAERRINLVNSGSPVCAKANSRKSTTGEEMSVWRALVLTRERASAAALADPCTWCRSVVNWTDEVKMSDLPRRMSIKSRGECKD